MIRFATLFLLILAFSMVSIAQTPNGKPAWNVTLQSNQTAPSNLTVQNRCTKKHTFDIQLQNLSFLELSKNEVKVNGGGDFNLPVRFNTSNLEPNKYEGQVLVICKTCQKEPGCTQDREVLPVILNVISIANATVVANEQDDGKAGQADATEKKKDPCREKCLDLLAAANAKAAAAKTAQNAADTAKAAADAADAKAKTAETAAERAEEMAKDVPRNDRAIVNGEKYTTADTEYRIQLQAGINAAHKAGQISDAEHERQTKANTTRKARDERLKNLAKLKKDAEKARAAADSARSAADKAKTDATNAQQAADTAKKAADDARNAYNDCVKKAKEECDKIKAAEAKKIANAKAAEEKRIADIKAAEDARIAAEQKKAAEEKERLKQKEEDERLLKLIEKMKLIDKEVRDVPGIWDWLPQIAQVPVGMLFEQTGAVPVPTDVLKALGGLYGLIANIRNPCNDAVGRPRIEQRLREMINEKTGRLYTEGEAAKEVTDMCNLMKRIQKNVKRLQAVRNK